MILGIVLGFAAPEFVDKTPDTIFSLLALVLWMLIEPINLVLFGNTFGRALLRTKITMQDGGKITYRAAFKRSFLVWVIGLGLGIPLISFICQIRSYTVLQDLHTTKWDLKSGTMVNHQKIGIIRIIIFLLIWLLFAFVIVWGNMA